MDGISHHVLYTDWLDYLEILLVSIALLHFGLSTQTGEITQLSKTLWWNFFGSEIFLHMGVNSTYITNHEMYL